MRCKCRQKLIRWGQTAAGTARWRCPACGRTKTRQKAGFRRHLLSRFLVEGRTANQLSSDLGLHPNTVRNRLGKYLNNPPPQKLLPEYLSDKKLWLITDATHFKRWGCLLITKTLKYKQPLAVSFHEKECFETVVKHLEPIRNLSVSGYTTDGKKGLVMAHRLLFPDAGHQRCLVHIRMKVQTLLTGHPRLPGGKDLLKLSAGLTQIKDTDEAQIWWVGFCEWQEKYQPVLTQRTHQGKSWWYTHRNLRYAWKHILNAADSLFVFLAYPDSVSHTNHLEGLFGQRKPALSRHRGLSRAKIANALFWTFYFLNKR
ncbi:MAG: transposase mutator type [Microgenomates group bacterium Gr01-1014_16]|nr:MAG: transposase mutator type [Microgenomates group bacterium Gr01-1014_16]